jgi:hypothetical protein
MTNLQRKVYKCPILSNGRIDLQNFLEDDMTDVVIVDAIRTPIVALDRSLLTVLSVVSVLLYTESNLETII